MHKIGMAFGQGGLYQRLKDYKLCYAFEDEFWVQFLIIGTTSDDSKTLEKKILARKELKKIEPTITLEGKKSLEYRLTSSRTSLNEAIGDVLKKNLNLWTHIVVFGPSGWRLIRSDDYPLELKMAKPSKNYTLKPKLFDSGKAEPKSKPKSQKTKKAVKPKKKKKPKGYFSYYDYKKAMANSLVEK